MILSFIQGSHFDDKNGCWISYQVFKKNLILFLIFLIVITNLRIFIVPEFFELSEIQILAKFFLFFSLFLSSIFIIIIFLLIICLDLSIRIVNAQFSKFFDSANKDTGLCKFFLTFYDTNPFFSLLSHVHEWFNLSFCFQKNGYLLLILQNLDLASIVKDGTFLWKVLGK